MPADKLVLRNHKLSSRFLKLAEQKGKPTFLLFSLHRPEHDLPGISGVPTLWWIPQRQSEITLRDVAHLGYTRCKEIAAEIFGASDWTRIMRVDWCVDLDIPLLDLALYCRLKRSAVCLVVRSRTGITFYLRRSKARTVMMYDKWRQLQAIRHPIAKRSCREHSLDPRRGAVQK